MKTRIPSVHIHLREDVQFNFNIQKNRIEVLNSDGEISNKHLISIGTVYQREKGPKVLRQIENQSGGIVSLWSDTNLFDRYFAIDTSYKKFGDNLICATACIAFNKTFDHKSEVQKGEEIPFLCMPRLCFLSKQNINPERHGWKRMIESLLTKEGFGADLRYGVVVDSDLGALPKINAREEPLVEDFFLPSNVSLIYASVDTGKEHVLNKLIGATDRIAAQALQRIVGMAEGQESTVFEGDFLDFHLFDDALDANIFKSIV